MPLRNFFKRKSIFILIALLYVLSSNSLSSNTLNGKIWANAKTQNSLVTNTIYKDFTDASSGLQFKKSQNYLTYNANLNFIRNNTISFDGSFLEYSYKNTTLGVGRVIRNWSFSPRTSLILSNNARPSKSIYLNIHSSKKHYDNHKSLLGPWSFELFNSILSNSTGPKNTMLLGYRVTTEPINNLKFELLKTSQWGGGNNKKNISAFKVATIGNTNEGEYSNINQIAGFGVSYLTNFNEIPVRFYSQFVGEDESNNLPSCFMKMVGLETDLILKKFPSTIGVEYVDTKISFSTNLHCGPNTAYNNATYKYNNYDKVLGAAIGSEGRSISFWGTTEISKNIFINYSFEDIIINDSDWSQHHLSSNKQGGNLITFGASYSRNNFKIQSQVSYQSFGLDKIDILEGMSISLRTTLAF